PRLAAGRKKTPDRRDFSTALVGQRRYSELEWARSAGPLPSGGCDGARGRQRKRDHRRGQRFLGRQRRFPSRKLPPREDFADGPEPGVRWRLERRFSSGL